MLEELPTEAVQTDLIRLAIDLDFSEFIRQQGLDDEESIRDVLELLASRDIATKTEELVNRVFKPKIRLAKISYATRFSDGSFPVLYGAIERQTAEAEVKHWFSQRAFGKPDSEAKAWYRRFSYRFNGEVKDLRPKRSEWPLLTHDHDYEFCNQLGGEAVESGLDGLLAPSVREEGGTSLPAFTRQAVSDFTKGELVTITYDAETDEVVLREA